jgi:uncharacterized protein YecA (UPF0149 family)
MAQKHEETGLAIREAPESQSPSELMMRAIEKNIKPEDIRQMMDLQIQWEKNQARKAYFAAMASFKAHPLEIEKDKHVKFTTQKGVTEYDHATLGNVTKQINSTLSQYGLSAAWDLAQDKNQVTVTCRISHALGHSESTSLTAGLDDSGGKNVIQQLGSTISYLERYTIMALTGTASKDQDDDGKSTKPGEAIVLITDKQKSEIVGHLNANGVTETRLLKFLGVESLDLIPAKDFNRAVASIKASKGKES